MLEHILVVDDDEFMRMTLETELEVAGYRVSVATNGHSAVALARQQHFDLIICDVRMPGIDGLQTLAALRQFQPDTRYIVVTGYADPEAPITALKLKVDDYLLKPFTSEQFLNSVRTSLESQLQELGTRRSTQKLREIMLHALEKQPPGARAAAARALRLARQLGLSPARAASLQLAAWLQGMEAELEQVDELKTLAMLLRQAQENWDGSGPAGLQGEQIPLEARILACARQPEGGDPKLAQILASNPDDLAPPAPPPSAPALTTTGAEIQLHILGRLRLASGGQPLGEEFLATRKIRSLFAFLASRRGHQASEEVLIDLFWGGAPKARHSLHNAISQIRKLLRPATMLVKTTLGYTLEKHPALWVDIEQFQHHTEESRRLAARNLHHEAAAELEKAEQIYQGDFLEGNYEEWTEPLRAHLLGELTRMLAYLAGHYYQSGKPDPSLIYWKRMLARDNCCEDAYLGCMLCHMALGNQSEAVRTYHLCAQKLREELNLTPPPRIVETYLRLLS